MVPFRVNPVFIELFLRLRGDDFWTPCFAGVTIRF